MNIKVLFIHPLENGLKSYIKVDQKIYLITFETVNNKAEFTVYSEDKSDRFLGESKIRQELLNEFILFLMQNKEEIKVGIYLDNSEEMFKKIFGLKSFTKKENGLVDATFFILENEYTISNFRVIKNRSHIYFDISNSVFKHENPHCFCESIKHNHDIKDFEHCLVLVEHQRLILDWLTREYKALFLKNKTAKVFQFPKK